MRKLLRFLCDESGATAIEYSLVALMISLAGIVGMTAVGNLNEKNFDDAAKGFERNK